LLTQLLRSTHVKVRVGTHKTPLRHPYDGLFEVVEAGPKFFVILMKGAEHKITVDRLKPATLPYENQLPSFRTTRSGHRQIPVNDTSFDDVIV
jgi:hypothetical protein